MPPNPVSSRRRALTTHRRASIAWATRDQRARRFALRHLFSKHLASGTLCLVPFDDHEVFVNPRDDKIAFTIMSGQPWQRRQFNNAMNAAQTPSRLRSDGVFVDVGANIGTVTLYALLSGHFSHVVAIEPDHANRHILERNLRHNKLTEKATVIAAAASNTTGTMTLHRDAKNLGAHSLEEGFSKSQSGSDQVRVDTLDNLITEAGFQTSDISFVKIDVEGHEHAVLKGMTQTFQTKPPVMLEATFEPTQTGSFSDPNATLTMFPDTYTHCTLLDGQAPQPGPRTEFAATNNQHDLLLT